MTTTNESNKPAKPLGLASTDGLGPPALDFAGNPVPQNCENCDGLYDDSDGIEYGPPSHCCDIAPHMHNLKNFPFKTPQKCFQIAWWQLVDWDAEWRKLDEEYRAAQRPNAKLSGPNGPQEKQR